MEQLYVMWMPRLLTIDQKLRRKNVSMKNMTLYKGNPSKFLRQFITVDETGVRHYTPEGKQQSKQWTGAGLISE